ncbi:cytoplasmic dynein 2 intermediate chain 1 isoform X2 [Xenopus laevis]|uniref:Cytoplasmic dynein 2 intermediate chain 1 isoform X2 n=1 Tax=Xenopus laevis TaxID=8355 RepID=A0A8J0VIJ1_XENLA|nr:cytoplasmic dynein 2 intermediate chain 1 isoform X2 [Xenopus laevis]
MSSATQQDRSKNKEDTWKSEELKRHLKASKPDDNRQKERRHRRNEDREEHLESRQKYNDKEKKEEQEHGRTLERYGDKDMDTIRNHHREKDKGRDYDRDQAKEKHKSVERKHSAEAMRKSHGVSKDYVSAKLEADTSMLKKRDVRERSDKSKQGDYDDEKRHRERREKEEKRRERAYDEDREQRYRKHREELETEDLDRERRRSERKHAERSTEDSERERRRSERKHMERLTVDEERRSEMKQKDVSSKDVDQERRRSERKHMERSKEGADREKRRIERKHRERSTEDVDRERRKSEQKYVERSTEGVDEERRNRERKHKEVSLEDVDRQRRRERKHREKYSEDADNVDGERRRSRRREAKHRERSTEDVDQAKLKNEQKHWERSTREDRHQGRSEMQSSEMRKPPLSKENMMDERERKHREQKNRKEHPDEGIKRTTEESENEGSADQAFSTDAANEDSTNYEEDFEDYADDFENESDNETEEPERNPEIEAIQRAMMLENEKIASFPSAPKQKERDEKPKQGAVAAPVKEQHRGVFIDFVSAKQRQVNGQIASKQKKRSTEILRLIDLDFSATLSLLDLHPVKEYEMYIRNFGRTNTKQAYVQCNEDNVDREVQTEEIDIEEKWTQHPGEGAVVSGGHKSDAAENATSSMKVDSQKLSSFLQSACQVIAVLLEEDRAEKRSDWNVQSKEPCMSISDGCFQLNTCLPFLQARQVYHLHFSPSQRHMLLTVHGLCKDPSIPRLDNRYIICVWNVWEPSTPQKVLICDAEVKCCCFSPGRAALVFAGTVDGTVAVWDLQEDPTMHHTMKIADTNWTIRSATFSTDGVFTPITHTCAVRAIEPVSSAAYKDHGISLLSSQEEGVSFQMASLDESAHLVIWVVVELRKVDSAGSQNDLGLIPGGKIKLVHSSSIHLDSNFFSKEVLSLGVPETLNIKFLPQDSNHFVIGTDIGIVARGTRYGFTEPPKQYKPRHGKLRPSKITAIDFSPFGASAFLAGCSDGCIRLQSLRAEFPIMQWSHSTGGQSVTALQWSLTRPTVFFVLDAACCIYIWDLMQNDLQPVAKETVRSDQLLCMATLGEPEKNNGLTGLVLAKASGKVDIQYIKKIWAKCQAGEMEKLQLFLQEIL